MNKGYRVNQSVVDLHPNKMGSMRITALRAEGAWCRVISQDAHVFRHYDDIRPETFWECCTRRTGFGETPWGWFGVIQGLCATIGAVSAHTGAWVGVAIIVAIEVGLVVSTYRRWSGKQS